MKYFTINELTRSETATAMKLDNTPTQVIVENLAALVDNVLDPLREAYGKPITVNSGYRSAQLNARVGGVSNSQHRTGQAADITVHSRNGNRKLFDLIRKLDLPFDQLIWEYGTLEEGPDWVHVSYAPTHRRQIIYKCTK